MESSKWCTNVTFKSCFFGGGFSTVPSYLECVSALYCVCTAFTNIICIPNRVLCTTYYMLYKQCAGYLIFWYFFLKNASNPTLPFCAKWKWSSYDANRTHLGICCRTAVNKTRMQQIKRQRVEKWRRRGVSTRRSIFISPCLTAPARNTVADLWREAYSSVINPYCVFFNPWWQAHTHTQTLISAFIPKGLLVCVFILYLWCCVHNARLHSLYLTSGGFKQHPFFLCGSMLILKLKTDLTSRFIYWKNITYIIEGHANYIIRNWGLSSA